MNRRGRAFRARASLRAGHAAFGAIALALAGLAVGCRGILGIHDLEDEPLGTNDGSTGDGSIGDAANDVELGADGCVVTYEDAGHLSNAIQVVSGSSFSCALTTDQNVWCWGANDGFQLGSDGPGKASNVPVLVPLAAHDRSGATAITAGESHACALMVSGKVFCWGDNTYGELGDPNAKPKSPPAGPSQTFFAVAAGAHHTCGVSSGSVLCWGANDANQQGRVADGGPNAYPVLSGAGVVSIAAGHDHTCAVLGDGGVLCWGDDSAGQLGTGSLDASISVVRSIFEADPDAGARAGGNDTCVIGSTGISCAGANAFSKIDSADADIVIPSPYSLVPGAVDIAVGGAHACAWDDARRLFCFGENKDKELGVGSGGPGAVVGIDGGAWFGPVANASVWSPTRSTNGGSFSGDAGLGHTCAIVLPSCSNGAGTVYCWGANASGELGDGTNDPSAVPVPVSVP